MNVLTITSEVVHGNPRTVLIHADNRQERGVILRFYVAPGCHVELDAISRQWPPTGLSGNLFDVEIKDDIDTDAISRTLSLANVGHTIVVRPTTYGYVLIADLLESGEASLWKSGKHVRIGVEHHTFSSSYDRAESDRLILSDPELFADMAKKIGVTIFYAEK